MNIEKINNTFIVQPLNMEFSLEGTDYEILSSEQCHIPTNMGLLFFDTSVTINDESFTPIQNWIDKLYE